MEPALPPETLTNPSDYSPGVLAILDAATPLFAEHGFSGVTTRQIAAAAELNISTVNHHVGGKADLYRKILERMYFEESTILREFTEKLQARPIVDAVTLRDAIFALLDQILDLMAENPSRAKLYVRRWLSPDDRTHEFTDAHGLELQATIDLIFSRALEAGVQITIPDPALLVRSFDWLILSYFVTGPAGPDRWRDDAFDANNVQRFRRYLRQYLCRMLDLPEAEESPAAAPEEVSDTP